MSSVRFTLPVEEIYQVYINTYVPHIPGKFFEITKDSSSGATSTSNELSMRHLPNDHRLVTNAAAAHGFASVRTSLPRAFAPPARRARRARPPRTSTSSAALNRAVLGEVCRLGTCQWWVRERPCRRRLDCASCLSQLGR